MLSVVEGRVLGCLLEKERTVPDQYPLTMNVLLAACNQTTGRDPLMNLAEHDVEAALASLKPAGFARVVHPSHGRSVTRYRHVADEKLLLEPEAAALLTVLLLRGAQTSGELHARSARLHDFGSNTSVEAALGAMVQQGLVERIERQPGQKEQRWRQLVADEVAAAAGSVGAFQASPGLAQRVEELERRIARIEVAIADLM